MNVDEFDSAVIGSSPLLMIVAAQRARKGERVALFEKADVLGGVWCASDIEGIGDVEIACHLIEWYRGGYAYLEAVSGQAFEPLEPRPVRILDEGAEIPYASRWRLLGELGGELLRFAGALRRLVTIWRFAGADREEQLGIVRQRLSMFRFFLRYRLPGLFAFDATKAPKGGYTAFIQGLEAEMRAAGVKVVKAEISLLAARGGKHEIHDKDGVLCVADRVYVGESTQIHEGGKRRRQEGKPFTHAAVSVARAPMRQVSPYIHLPKNEYFQRITLIREFEGEKGDARMLLLVQIREAFEDYDMIEDEISRLFASCGIIPPGHGVAMHRLWTQLCLAEPRHSPWRDAEPHDGFHVVPTVGNLSRSVLRARDLGLLPRHPRRESGAGRE